MQLIHYFFLLTITYWSLSVKSNFVIQLATRKKLHISVLSDLTKLKLIIMFKNLIVVYH